MSKGTLLAIRPVVVIHPMEKIEGGLTEIERRAFQELATAAGARETVVHEGTEIPLYKLKEGNF